MDNKALLLQEIAGKNRGLLATEIDRINILSLVEHLEDDNPHGHPLAQEELLQGDWRLIYTTSKSLLGLNNIPLVNLGQIYQCIRPQSQRIINIAEVEGIPFLEGVVAVVAQFEAVSEKRVNVQFERSIITSQRLMGYRSARDLVEQIEGGKRFFPLDFPIPRRSETAWLEITYLDEDLRLGRGNEGNVFILSKSP